MWYSHPSIKHGGGNIMLEGVLIGNEKTFFFFTTMRKKCTIFERKISKIFAIYFLGNWHFTFQFDNDLKTHKCTCEKLAQTQNQHLTMACNEFRPESNKKLVARI